MKESAIFISQLYPKNGSNMIFTKLEIDNLYCFDKTVFDFTYKKKPVYSSIDNEYLQGIEGFKYKKVCILSGANATGKTSIGRIIRNLQIFIAQGRSFFFEDPNLFPGAINDKSKSATIRANFVDRRLDGSFWFNFLEVIFDQKKVISMKYSYFPLFKTDTNTSVDKKLKEIIDSKGESYSRCVYIEKDHIFKITAERGKDHRQSLMSGDIVSGWYYELAENIEKKNSFEQDHITSVKTISSILKCFDPSVDEVVESVSTKDGTTGFDGYVIHFKNSDKILLDKNGESTQIDRLSKGTYDAIKTSLFVSRIIYDNNAGAELGNIYFLDEKMAYAHSALEQAIVNLIIDKLPIFSQFFYTTHNHDILELELPTHSYLFLKKNDTNNIVELVDTTKFNIKNDRKISNMIKKDVFGITPHVDDINQMLWE